ncbi:MAG: hypothetical protein IKN59_06135 [Paludibacteraceae bacterium]|nr:hypothetical protein [Paludibacteraceae bacterium]
MNKDALTYEDELVLNAVAAEDSAPRIDGERLAPIETLLHISDLNGAFKHVRGTTHQSITARVDKLVRLGYVEVLGESNRGRILGIIPDKYREYYKSLSGSLKASPRPSPKGKGVGSAG